MSSVPLSRRARLAIVLGALLIAAGCTSKAQEARNAASCPKAYIVGDAAQLTRFKPGPGRDPTDVLFRADIMQAENKCSFSRSGVVIDTKLTLAVQEGPAAATQNRQAALNYFVALIGPNSQILAREEFTSDFRFEGNRTRLAGVEELTQRAGFTADDAGGYQVAVGLALSHEELDYNRRLQR
ncbi:MAG: hypothetical protein AB7R90_01910 [Reyranellaceae bacterium]